MIGFRDYVIKLLREKVGSKIIFDEEYIEKYLIFSDRYHAGQILSEMIESIRLENPVILAIPCGGVPVAYVVSRMLNLPMDLMICRKVLIPWNTEAGYGACAPDGTTILNEEMVKALGFTKKEIKEHVSKTLREIERRLKLFRGTKEYFLDEYNEVILIDDGLATGYTMLTAIKFVKNFNVDKVIVSVPTASLSSIFLIKDHVFKIICPNVRSDFLGFAVADAYKLWYDVSDSEVIRCLRDLGDLYIPYRLGKIKF